MAKYKVGYIYKQKWEMDGRTGFTTRCILHNLDDAGNIRKTFDYKVARQFEEYITLGECGSPAFDSFGRLADFFDQ